jgi:hypothetical protein
LENGEQDEQVKNLNTIPKGRMGNPDEVEKDFVSSL